MIKDTDDGRAGNERINISLAQAKRVLGDTSKYKLLQGFKDYLEVSKQHGFWSYAQTQIQSNHGGTKSTQFGVRGI